MPQLDPSTKYTQPPTLLSVEKQNAFSASALFEALEQQDKQPTDFTASLKDCAQQAGMEFLFEMPGSLFDKTDIRAFALRQGRPNSALYGFLFYEIETKTIAIMQYSEIGFQAQAFFSSYSSVLACLKDLKPISHIH